MEVCAASDGIAIKRDGGQYALFVSGSEVERCAEYGPLAKLATEIHVARCMAAGDEMIGKRMFAPSDLDISGSVIVVAKTAEGYMVQKSGSDQRFEVLPEFLSEVPTQYFE